MIYPKYIFIIESFWKDNCFLLPTVFIVGVPLLMILEYVIITWFNWCMFNAKFLEFFTQVSYVNVDSV